MTGSWPIWAAHHVLDEGSLDDVALQDARAVLDSIDPRFPSLIGTLAEEFGLPLLERRRRVGALCLMFATVQLADDLADGECDYLPEAHRRGPGTQWLLQHLSVECLLNTECTLNTVTGALRCFARMGSAQQLEVRRAQWDLDSARGAATGLNGNQFAAYFGILADGTVWAERASRIGQDFGEVLHVVGDSVSSDPRISTLTDAERLALCGWAQERLHRLLDTNLVVIQRVTDWFSAVLASTSDSAR